MMLKYLTDIRHNVKMLSYKNVRKHLKHIIIPFIINNNVIIIIPGPSAVVFHALRKLFRWAIKA